MALQKKRKIEEIEDEEDEEEDLQPPQRKSSIGVVEIEGLEERDLKCLTSSDPDLCCSGSGFSKPGDAVRGGSTDSEVERKENHDDGDEAIEKLRREDRLPGAPYFSDTDPNGQSSGGSTYVSSKCTPRSGSSGWSISITDEDMPEEEWDVDAYHTKIGKAKIDDEFWRRGYGSGFNRPRRKDDGKEIVKKRPIEELNEEFRQILCGIFHHRSPSPDLLDEAEIEKEKFPPGVEVTDHLRQLYDNYQKQVRESGGYDITDFPGSSVMTPIVPEIIPDNPADPYYQELEGYLLKVIDYMNDPKHRTGNPTGGLDEGQFEYQFHRIVSCNVNIAQYSYFYFTFEAKKNRKANHHPSAAAAVDDPPLIVTFQTLISETVDNLDYFKIVELRERPPSTRVIVPLSTMDSEDGVTMSKGEQ